MNIVITGASRGLGKAIAELFAANGYNLYLTSRSAVALYKTMEKLTTRFPDVTIKAKPFDLSEREQVRQLAEWILGLDITVDILVNNAGSFEPGSVYNEPEGTMESMMNINFFSAYHLTRALIPEMIKRKSGHIFNMCSIASFQAYKNGGAYSISKFALAGFSKNLREEMKPFGIKVTSVYPGAANTDSWAGSGIDPKRIMETADIAMMIFSSSQLSVQACVEEIVLRPQLGDL
ncbi:MAG: SDR family oxidoreductase [Chitinophagaceae bacterium]|nr:SDR family oxidoreductase [Chitinophagaceae bacterium]